LNPGPDEKRGQTVQACPSAALDNDLSTSSFSIAGCACLQTISDIFHAEIVVQQARSAMNSCRIPDDWIDNKRYPLFMARSVLQALLEQLKS
jgi:hypothetical protein